MFSRPRILLGMVEARSVKCEEHNKRDHVAL